MSRPQQPWYLPRPPQQPVPGNPYAPDGYSPQGPPPRRRRFGMGPVATTVVALLLLVAGGGVYAVNEGRQHRPAAPGAKKTPGPSATRTGPPSSALPTRGPKRIPTSEEINAGREPGEAAAWIVDDPTDLPGRHIPFFDLWIVGDTVVQAVHKKVTAYRLSDGAEVWNVPLPAPVCETPVNPTPDGKVVLVYGSSQAQRGNRCNQLQMIDLRTGKADWHKELTETGSGDDTIIVNSAISGDTFAIVQSMRAAAYRVSDGGKLYDIPREDPGQCYPDDVAGGARLLVSAECAISVDRSKTYSGLREIDPRTGQVLWRYRTRPGWKIGKMLSVDPVVFTTLHNEERTDNWRVVALGPRGKLRTTIDARPKGFTYCGDTGESDNNIQNCKGTVVDEGVVHLGGTDQVGGYDLGTGAFVWGVKSQGSILTPLRADGGRSALVYETPTSNRPGGIIRLGPGGAETKKRVLRHPVSARAPESGMLAGQVAYVNNRIVITPGGMSGRDDSRVARMLSFAPDTTR